MHSQGGPVHSPREAFDSRQSTLVLVSQNRAPSPARTDPSCAGSERAMEQHLSGLMEDGLEEKQRAPPPRLPRRPRVHLQLLISIMQVTILSLVIALPLTSIGIASVAGLGNDLLTQVQSAVFFAVDDLFFVEQ